jgi:hypothetical protein
MDETPQMTMMKRKKKVTKPETQTHVNSQRKTGEAIVIKTAIMIAPETAAAGLRFLGKDICECSILKIHVISWHCPSDFCSAANLPD